MDDLTAFLRARLDEREHLALAASPGPWSPNAESDEVVAVDGITVADGFALSGRQLRATVEHIALNDPPSVLADVASKRRILGEYETARAFYEQQRDAPAGEVHGLLTAVKLLALPYAGHPDYQEGWEV